MDSTCNDLIFRLCPKYYLCKSNHRSIQTNYSTNYWTRKTYYVAFCYNYDRFINLDSVIVDLSSYKSNDLLQFVRTFDFFFIPPYPTRSA